METIRTAETITATTTTATETKAPKLATRKRRETQAKVMKLLTVLQMRQQPARRYADEFRKLTNI